MQITQLPVFIENRLVGTLNGLKFTHSTIPNEIAFSEAKTLTNKTAFNNNGDMGLSIWMDIELQSQVISETALEAMNLVTKTINGSSMPKRDRIVEALNLPKSTSMTIRKDDASGYLSVRLSWYIIRTNVTVLEKLFHLDRYHPV